MLVEQYFRDSRVILKIIILLLSIITCSSKPLEPLGPVLTVHESKTPPEPIQDPNIPTEDVFRNDINQKKLTIIIVILSFCVVCAIILSFVNVHDDYVELNNFYRGYMGRRLLIQEKRLLYKAQVDRVQQFQSDLGKLKQQYSQACHKAQNGGVNFIKMEENLSPTSQMDSVFSISPVTTTSLLPPGEVEDSWFDLIKPGMPVVRRFIEDEEPEWRGLDYHIGVGKPPTSFCSFIRQYDYNMFTGEGMTPKEIEERKNLLNQFRKWKKRKRKTFNIVVTERARREMADQEEEKNKKRTPPAK